MNVIYVEKSSLVIHLLINTSDLTLDTNLVAGRMMERSHINVRSVGKPLVTSSLLENMNGITEKNAINVRNVGRLSLTASLFSDMRGPTQVKNPMNAKNVGRHSVL